jgi:hypothetical protein
VDILRGNPYDWSAEWTPPEYQDDRKPYSVCIILDKIEPVTNTHISDFPMYGDEDKHYARGNQGPMLVVDFLGT